MNILDLVKSVRTVALNESVLVETIPTPAAISQLYQRQASLDPSWRKQKIEKDTRGRLSASHSLSLGASPMLNVAWHADPSWYESGYRIELFVSNTGFPSLSNLTPLEQLDHGRLISESHRNGETTFSLCEGQSFISMLLIGKKPEGIVSRAIAIQRQRWTGSPIKVAAIVRFTVDVPSLILANNRITQQTLYTECLVKNITARVQLASASGDLDIDWYSARFETDVRRQTEELLATLRGTEEPFAKAKLRINSDQTLSTSARATALSIVERLRLETLRLRQLPVQEPVHEIPASASAGTDPSSPESD